MNTSLAMFSFNNNHVDIREENGDLLFRASHITEILEYSSTTEMLSLIDEIDDLAKCQVVDSVGRTQKVYFLSEPQLYEILCRSNKDKTKTFKKWLFSEVLPSIRKYGKYSIRKEESEAKQQFLDTHDFLIRLQPTLGFNNNQVLLICDKTVKKEYGLSLLDKLEIKLISEKQEQMLTPTDIALELSAKKGKKITNREVNIMLVNLEYQVKLENKTYMPTNKGQAYCIVLDTNKKHSDGTFIKQLKWYNSIIAELEKRC